MKYSKPFLAKGTLLDTTILSMFTSYIKNGVLVKFVVFNFNIAKRYNFFTHFVYSNEYFYKFFYVYNTHFFLVKTAFCNTFTTSLLLILLIIQR